MKIYAKEFESEEQGTVVIARTSRSPNTFDVIEEEVKVKGHKQFIKDNVLGYGHDSVAEGAQCPWVCIEDVSDLVANVIATSDPQLRVQMTSTRYQDMGKRTPFEQEDTGEGYAMRGAYIAHMPLIQKILEDKNHPRKRTLQCDIARSRLPAGISTQLGIRGDARTMRDVVSYLLGHELAEAREAGELIRTSVKPFIETLFDRHITAAKYPVDFASWHQAYDPGTAYVNNVYVADSETEDRLVSALEAWRASGWRQRVRPALAPGAFMQARITSDWGAYRDLRRNRTIHQTDVMPSPLALPDDALWAFRDLYPDVCDEIDTKHPEMAKFSHYAGQNPHDPYLAPMGSLLTWKAAGHILNFAYFMRARSGAVCHPGYALPTRHIMTTFAEQQPVLARAMGLVYSSKSLNGVEFEDRVPEGSNVRSV